MRISDWSSDVCSSDLGATVFRELFGSSLTMGEEVLAALGMPPEQAADHAARFREHDNKLLRAQHLVYDDDVALRQTSHESRVELMQLFAADSSGAAEPAQAPVHPPQEGAIFCRSGGDRKRV